MPRTRSLHWLAFCLALGPSQPLRSEPPDSSGKQSGADLFGDPLPIHALGRVGTVRLRQPDAHSLAFSPDGKILASGGDSWYGPDTALRLWDAATGKELRRFRGDLPGVLSVAFAPDGK